MVPPQPWHVRKQCLRKQFEKDTRGLLLLHTVSHYSCSSALPGPFKKGIDDSYISQAEDTGKEVIYDIMEKQRNPQLLMYIIEEHHNGDL